MSNKGEDVKQLFAHLGLDPSSYRDLKGEGDKDEVEGRVGGQEGLAGAGLGGG